MRQPARRVDPETVLDQAELDALEPRRRNQQIAEVQEIEPGHRLQDVDLVEQQPLDLGGRWRWPTASMSRSATTPAKIPTTASGSWRMLHSHSASVRLVHDDEQQLVVGMPAVPITLGLLARQELLEPEVVVVVQRLLGVAHRQQT